MRHELPLDPIQLRLLQLAIRERESRIAAAERDFGLDLQPLRDLYAVQTNGAFGPETKLDFQRKGSDIVAVFETPEPETVGTEEMLQLMDEVS